MRREMIVVSLMLGLGSNAFAARKYGAAGCGLGSIVMGPKGNQIIASTLNSTGYQTFAITTGTSNCVNDAEAAAYIEQEIFVRQNLVVLSKEMAQGSGETVEALVDTLGCDKADAPNVAKELQKGFAEIFAAPGAIAVLEATVDRLKARPAVSKSCKYLG